MACRVGRERERRPRSGFGLGEPSASGQARTNKGYRSPSSPAVGERKIAVARNGFVEQAYCVQQRFPPIRSIVEVGDELLRLQVKVGPQDPALALIAAFSEERS
jgi:hypothetical protein